MEILIVFMSLTVTGLFFGYWYAWRIATNPLEAWKTWVEVLVGVGVTCIIMGAVMIIVFTTFEQGPISLLVVFLIPTWCFGLTGLPMILGQQLKKFFNRQHNIIRRAASDAARAAWKEAYRDDDTEEGVASEPRR